MPFNGSGTFDPIPSPDYPAVAGTLIKASSFNLVINDILAGLTNALTRDGQSPPTANLPMGGKRITGLGAPLSAGDAFSVGSPWVGNFSITGAGARLQGDFSNATVASRLCLQTSTLNANTAPVLIPNGTANFAGFQCANNSDPTNSGMLQIGCSAATASVTAGIFGTGTYLPLAFYTGGAERFRLSATVNRLQADFSSATTSNRLIFQTTDTAALGTTIGACPNTSGYATTWAAYSRADVSNCSVAFLQVNDSSGAVTLGSSASGTGSVLPVAISIGGVDRLRIDTAGKVTTPSQPSFDAYRSAAQNSGSVAIYDTVTQDGGTNYDTGTGRFTAPVAGWYQFNVEVNIFNNTGAGLTGNVFIRKNLTADYKGAMGLVNAATGQYAKGNITWLGKLAAGDVIDVYCPGLLGANVTIGADGNLNRFSGRLVG